MRIKIIALFVYGFILYLNYTAELALTTATGSFFGKCKSVSVATLHLRDKLQSQPGSFF